MAHMVIMRGLPGSGKSSLVEVLRKNLANEHGVHSHVASADLFFEDEDGNYNFNPSKLSEAHESCYDSAFSWVDLMQWYRDRKGVEAQDVLFVDNTNTQLFEMSPYIMLAQKFEVPVLIVEMWRPDGLHAASWVRQCAERNSHGVPVDAVRRMWDRMENTPPFWPTPIGAWHHSVLGFEPAARSVMTLGGLV